MRLKATWITSLALAGFLAAAIAGAAPAPSNLSLLSATERTVTIGWTKADNATGYALLLDGKKVATAGPSAVAAKFGVSYGSHTLGVQSVTNAGLTQLSTITVTNVWRSTGTTYPPPPLQTTTTTPTTTTGNPQSFNFSSAYQSGGTFVLACGTYPAANLQGAGKPVTFTAATQGCVTLPGITITNGASGITFTGVNAASFYINGVTNIALTYSNFGPCSQTPTSGCGPNDIDSNPAGNNIILDHDTIHDYSTPTQYESQFHQQCLTIAGETNVTVSNSTFYGCQVFDIFLQYGSSVAAGNFDGLKLVNNSFAAPLQDNGQTRDSAVEFSPRGYQFKNVTVSGNTFASGSGMVFDETTPAPTAFAFSANNSGIAANCIPGITYSNNTWASGNC